jgi:cell division cycle 2-like protein
MDKDKEGFPVTSLREINLLITLGHPNVVEIKEIVIGKSLDSIFIVMEFLEHNLRDLMTEMKTDTKFLTSEVKCLMKHLLTGVAYLHKNWVVHRFETFGLTYVI